MTRPLPTQKQKKKQTQPITISDWHHQRDYYHLRNLFNQLDNEHPNPHPTQTIAKTQ